MYHINADRRTKRSCEMIYRALLFIIESQHVASLDEVTVLQLAQISMTSRGTFYRHFDEVVDVLAWKSDEKAAQSCDGRDAHDEQREDDQEVLHVLAQREHVLDCQVQTRTTTLLLRSLEKFFGEQYPLLHKNAGLSETRQKYVSKKSGPARSGTYSSPG